MSTPVFSILVPAIHTRTVGLFALIEELTTQAAGFPVEIVCVLDNKKRSIGAKRQACLDIARGEYIAFVDDDDWVSPGYVIQILSAIERSRPDVVCFDQISTVNGDSYRVRFRVGASNEEARQVSPGVWANITRPPWHVCAWRRELAITAMFPDTNYGEDWAWASQLQDGIKSNEVVDAVLHEYRFNTETSEAKA